MTETAILTLVGEVLIVCAGMVVMSIASVAIDQLLGIEVSGSHSAKICHNILGMTKGAFLVWLMSVTVFS